MSGALLGALVTVVGTFVELRPNRILGGEELSGLSAFGLWGWVLLGLWAVMFAACLPGTGRVGALVRGLVANLSMAGSTLLVTAVGAAYLAGAGEIARVSLGLTFWLSLGAAYVVIFSALPRAGGRIARALVSLPGVAAIVVMLLAGRLDSLSIMAEYAVNATSFHTALRQQLAYTLGATGVALVLGLTAGIAAAKSRRVEGPVFAVLNVAQVLPSLSFIGLLIVPMGWLGLNVPALKAVGVSGIGWAPVFVVLLAYALFPITRNVFTALKSLDGSVTDAARGMGMKTHQRLLSIELPLAFPVIIAGVRIAAVQTTAAAILAALVGGGGLGQIVFFGVQQTATDLILLGVIPIVALSLAIDGTLRVFEALVRHSQEGSPA